MVNKIAVVTGTNKGLGYGIVKLLCKRGVNVVYLTSRDVKRGLEAIEKLSKEGLKPLYYQLDTLDANNIKAFADHIKNKHGGFDIIINNAAVLGDLHQLSYEDAKNVIDTNYTSNLLIQKYLFPLLRDSARVVNISSDGGLISNLRNPEWIRRITNKDVSLTDVNSFVEWFLESVKNDTFTVTDFNFEQLIPYRVSKIALNALTRIQQRLVGRDISVNAIHPGYVQTDMVFNTGTLTVDEGSEVPVYLALDIDQTIKGKYFWYDKSEKDWTDENIKIEGSITNLEEGFSKLAENK